MDRPFNNVSFVLQRCLTSKTYNGAGINGFLVTPTCDLFPESSLTFKSKKAQLPFLSSSSMANYKFGCNLLAASTTSPGSALTVLTMSSTCLRKKLKHHLSPICFLLFFATNAIPYCFSDVCVFGFQYVTQP